jgi:large subunit ribosomal protein L17
MRHQKKRHRLGLPADQRRALLRNLATQVLKHGRVETTEAKAKAVKAEVERMISLAKRGKQDLSARRAVSAYLLENRSSTPVVLTVDKKDTIDETKYRVVKRDDKSNKVKAREKTVAQRLFETVAPGYADRNGGYVRILHLPPRRGDGAPMALIELV